MWNFVTIFMIFCVSTDAVNIIVTGSKSNEKTISCHRDKEVSSSITVLEGELLTISVQQDGKNRDNNIIRCTSTVDPTLLLFSNGSMTGSLTVSKNMGGKWHCTTASDDCFIILHVRLEVSPQKVLQHNMVIPTVWTNASLDVNYDHMGSIFYTDGDNINMTCIVEDNTLDTQRITLKYICPGVESKVNQGFQPLVGSSTEKCHLLCTHKDKNDFSVTKVIFVHQALENGSYIKVNGYNTHPQRLSKPDGFRVIHFNPTYIFSKEDIVNISCHTNIKGWVVRSACGLKSENDTDNYKKEVTNFPSPIRCSICKKDDSETQRFTVNFRKIDFGKMLKYASPIDPEENKGSPIGIICGVIAAVLSVIAIIFCVVKMKKQGRSTAHVNKQNGDSGVPQTGEQNSEYSEPYDHMRNRIPWDVSAQPQRLTNNYSTSPKKATSKHNTNSNERISQIRDDQNSNDADHGQNRIPEDVYSEVEPNLRDPKKAMEHTNITNERTPQILDHRNSVYTNPTDKDELYAKTVPKNLRPRDNNTTGPEANNPAELDTPEYLNESEITSQPDQHKETNIVEDPYVNERNIGDYGNITEPLYGNS